MAIKVAKFNGSNNYENIIKYNFFFVLMMVFETGLTTRKSRTLP